MKTKSTLLTTVWLAILTGTGLAGTIGVNFNGGNTARNVLSTDNPGIAVGANWTNITGASGTGIALQDGSAAATTATLTFSAGFQYAGFGTPATANTGANTMYTGGLGGANATAEATVTVSNIPYPLYDIYVFGSADSTKTNLLSVTDGTTTFYYRSAEALNTGATALLKTSSTTAGAPTIGKAQYQVFSRLTSPTLTLTQSGSISGTLSNNLFGFHIVEVNPELPVLSGPTVADITATTALAAVTLVENDAEVTLFWYTEDQGTGSWPHSNTLGAQVVGPVTGAITGLAGDTRYFYRFHAVNTVPDPDLDTWSAAATSFITALTGKAVTDLQATLFDTLEIDLMWTDNFDTETGFIIQRALDVSGPWTTIATKPANSIFHTDTGAGLAAGTTYHYRVLATNAAGDSDPSNVADQTTDPATPLATQLLVHFNGALDDNSYTLDAAEIDTTESFKANGYPSIAAGLATINPGTGGGTQGFDFNPSSLGGLVKQNWVAEAVVFFNSFAGQLPTVLDVQGDSEFRITNTGANLEMVYWNGSTDGKQLASLPPLGATIHLALVWDGPSLTLTGYVDGRSIGQVSQGAFVVPDPNSVSFGYFGRTGFDKRGIDGVLDAVAFSSGTTAFDPATDFRILPKGTSYTSWLADYPGVGDQTGFNQDPDGDGLSNGIESFFGTDPGAWSTGLAGISTAGTTTSFTHPLADLQLNNVTGSYQWSLDLVTWYAGDGIDGPAGGPTVMIVAALPTGGSVTVTATASKPVVRLFVRVAATTH